MMNQEKKVKYILYLIGWLLIFTVSQSCARENAPGIILFEKQVEDNGIIHKLFMTKTIVSGDSDSCDDSSICFTALLNMQYLENDKIKWVYEDRIKDCSYDIKLDLFVKDVIFKVIGNVTELAIGYEKICSSSLDPTIVVVTGINNNESFTVSSDEEFTSYNNERVLELLNKLITQRETYFLDMLPDITGKDKTLDSFTGNDAYFVTDIDIDRDGDIDKVVSSQKYEGDELYLYEMEGGEYELILQGSNLSEDGGLIIKSIAAETTGNKVFSITTYFPDGGHLEAKHIIEYFNDEWVLARTDYKTTVRHKGHTRDYLCTVKQGINLKDLTSNSPAWDLFNHLPEEGDRDLLCSFLILDSNSSIASSQSMIDVTDASARDNSLLIKIQKNILLSSQLNNINELNAEISEWRSDIAKYCEEQYQEGSARFLEQYSCMNNYQTQLVKVLNDRLHLYPPECPLPSDVDTAVVSHTDLAVILCKAQKATCLAAIDKRLASGVDNLEYCVPDWLTELKSDYAYKIKAKSYLYENAAKKHRTKMYLIKGDKVNILDEKTDDSGQKWYYINYKGKKDLNMWIKGEAVDTKPVKSRKENK